MSKNSKGEDVLTVPISSKPGKKEYLELAFVLAQSGEVGVIKQYEGDLDKWEHVILNMYHADGRKFISGVYNTKTKMLTVKPLLSDKFSKLEKIASTSSSGNGSSEDGWTFTTLYEPRYADHPVSGNRDFGYAQNTDGSYTFYTRGVDRLTEWDGAFFQWVSNYPFEQADALWTSFQNMMTSYVNQHGGSAVPDIQEFYRPNWQRVKDVIDGKSPLSDLSTDCK